MSLTSQIKDKNSSVRKFFTEFEDEKGFRECLGLLQSTQPLQLPGSPHASTKVYSFIGTATDYLIRYTADKNKLIFDDTIAYQALKKGEHINSIMGQNQDMRHLKNLYEIAKRYLDGRDATDHKAIYSATALSIMDNVLRSGYLPGLFSKKSKKKKSASKDLKEDTTKLLLDEYYEELGGVLYAQDIANLISIFVTARKDPESEFFDAQFVVFNQALRNSGLVGGADFDCVIAYDNRLILTDIKTITEKLRTESLRQIIGYALLYDPKKDDFEFTDIGIYHSRSGSFRFLPLNDVIKKVCPDLNSVSRAREVFIGLLEKAIVQ